MTEMNLIRDHAEGPHHCECKKIHRCPIFTHPDAKVQTAIADLAEEMARYDVETGNISTLVFHTDYLSGGAFHSETINTKVRDYSRASR